MNLAVALVLMWAFGALMFVAGTLWASRRPEPRPPVPPPPVRTVARPCLIVGPREAPIAIAEDYLACRADFDRPDRDVLDTLVLLDALWRGKW